MNRTFTIISIHFPQFKTPDWIGWFKVKLIPVLPSFTAEMLATATSNVNCTDYRVMWVHFHLPYRLCIAMASHITAFQRGMGLKEAGCCWGSMTEPLPAEGESLIRVSILSLQCARNECCLPQNNIHQETGNHPSFGGVPEEVFCPNQWTR